MLRILAKVGGISLEEATTEQFELHSRQHPYGFGLLHSKTQCHFQPKHPYEYGPQKRRQCLQVNLAWDTRLFAVSSITVIPGAASKAARASSTLTGPRIQH
mgnify:CR=1 FL=1